MRRYMLPGGRVRPAQPGVRLERQLLARGGILVEDDDPALIEKIPAKDLDQLAGLEREQRWQLALWARAAAAKAGAVS